MKQLTLIIIAVAAFLPVEAECEEERRMISCSHGYEIALGWWGWMGGSEHVASVMKDVANKAISDPEENKYCFEYDGVSWDFFNKRYPDVTERIRQAVELGAWDVVGGTYGGQLPYQIGLESQIRQLVMGKRAIREALGLYVKTYAYQEFFIYPQAPMFLINVGIENATYENQLPICGRVNDEFGGIRWMEANDGSRVRALSRYPGLRINAPDVLDIEPYKYTLTQFIEKFGENPNEKFNHDEDKFYFNAADYTDSYGNMASITNCLVENKLLSAERLAALSAILGGNSYSWQLSACWKYLLATQNHDIMYCGSECYASEVGASDWEAAKYLRQAAEKLASDVEKKSLAFIAARVNTTAEIEGKGEALIVFNPLGHTASRLVETELSFAEGVARGLTLFDEDGKYVPVQLSAIEKHDNGSLKGVRMVFYANDLPGLGYSVYQLQYVAEADKAGTATGLSVDREKGVIENRYVKMKFQGDGQLLAVYSKLQEGKLILGADEGETPALRLVDTVGGATRYKPIGWTVLESGPEKVVVKSSYESKLGFEDIHYTIYDDIRRIDMIVELRSKDETGDVLEMSKAPKKERLWLQFMPAFEGKAKCDTIADILREQRNIYFSNTWINYSGGNTGFTLMHKGMHGWCLRNRNLQPQPLNNWSVFQRQINRLPYYNDEKEKKDAALAVQLGQTTVRWVPGMLRLNTSFGENGTIKQYLALWPEKTTDEYRINKAVQDYYLPALVKREEHHNGSLESEKSFVNVRDGDVLLSAFYANETTGGQPAMRLWNVRRQKVVAEVKLGFDEGEAVKIRFDGVERGDEYSWDSQMEVMASALETVKFVGMSTKVASPVTNGIINSTLPYYRIGKDILFEAPLESSRAFIQMAQFRGDKGRIYSYVDPYDEIVVQFSEFRQEGDYRIFDAKVNVPLEMRGRKVRLVLHWDTHSLYAIGSCALSLDYRLRSDEPLEVFVNGRKVKGYAFDLTEYVNFGEINRISIKAVAPEVKREDILELGDDRVVDLDSYFSCHGFDKIKSAKLRVGKKLTEKNYRQLADCSMMNSGFDSGDSRGWQTEGNIEIVRDIGRRVKIIGKGGVKQAIEIKPGNYSLKVDLRTQGRNSVIGVIGEREFSSEVKSNGEWETHTVVFHVPEEEYEVTVYARTGEGEGDVEIDSFRIVANKVWKQ